MCDGWCVMCDVCVGDGDDVCCLCCCFWVMLMLLLCVVVECVVECDGLCWGNFFCVLGVCEWDVWGVDYECWCVIRFDCDCDGECGDFDVWVC